MLRHSGIPRAERFILRRSLIPQRPRQKPRHRIHHQHRWQFPAAQYKIPHRNLFRCQMLRHPLVHPFIPPADKNNPLQSRKPPRRFLRKSLPRRGQQNNRRIGFPFGCPRCISHAAPQQRLHRFEQRFRLHHHAFASAEWPVVHRAMAVLGELPQILHSHLDQAGLPRPPHNSVLQRPREKLRKNANQVESHAPLSLAYFYVVESSPVCACGSHPARGVPHFSFSSRSPSGSCTSMRRAAVSILVQISSASGISSSPSRVSTTSSGVPATPSPVSCTSVTLPNNAGAVAIAHGEDATGEAPGAPANTAHPSKSERK